VVNGTLAGSTNDSYTMLIKNITQNTSQNFVTNFGLSSGNLSSLSRLDSYTLSTPLNVTSGDKNSDSDINSQLDNRTNQRLPKI
jgi:hypothetical protein